MGLNEDVFSTRPGQPRRGTNPPVALQRSRPGGAKGAACEPASAWRPSAEPRNDGARQQLDTRPHVDSKRRAEVDSSRARVEERFGLRRDLLRRAGECEQVEQIVGHERRSAFAVARCQALVEQRDELGIDLDRRVEPTDHREIHGDLGTGIGAGARTILVDDGDRTGDESHLPRLARGAVEPLARKPNHCRVGATAEPGDLVTVNEEDDGRALFRQALSSLGTLDTIGIGARTWGESVIELQDAVPAARLVNGTPIVNELRRVKSPLELELMTKACRICDDAMVATREKVAPGVTMTDLVEEVEHQMRIRGSRTPSFPTHIFSHGYERSHDSTLESALEPIAEGEAVMFDFGALWQGYCSDFGRTVVCGEPHPEYERVYGVMLAAQESGRAAAVPGALACEVNAACRAPIEEAGLGEFFRHRMGHGIGLDVHEQPFISVEDRTPLEAGMTFTDEPSILWDGHFAVRVEDVVVCADGGGRTLNGLSGEMVVREVQGS